MTFFALLAAALASLISPARTLPPVAVPVDYQLGGAYPPAAGVRVVTRDLDSEPADGLYSICYINAFQTQPGELSWWKDKHPGLLLRAPDGDLVRDPDWPDEALLDIRTTAERAALTAIILGRFEKCANKGFKAVEPDNLDSWTRSRGLLRRQDAIAFARELVGGAHSLGLAIAQKNAADIPGHRLGFDFAVTEECEVYRECGRYLNSFGRHVIEIEYTDNGRAAFARACRAREKEISILLRDRGLVPRGRPHYADESC